MKLLLQSTDRALLMEKASLLQSRGVPVHLDEVAHVGALPSHLYVVFDHHLEEAQALLEDQDYQVRQPLYPSDMEQIADESREAVAEMGTSFLNRMMLALLACMTVLYVAARVFG